MSWFWDAITPDIPANRTASTVQRHERDICPRCGKRNDPDASVREHDDLRFCNYCHESWRPHDAQTLGASHPRQA